MSGIFVDRSGGRLALYLGGDLQFDAADEARYHEPLGLVPVALAAARAPDHSLRVLILGGGDGLALREVLKFGEVGEAHVVDRDPEVLGLGRTVLGALNRRAFDDPRVRVHARDVRDVIGEFRSFDVVVCDLTYPRDVAGAAIHSVGFYTSVRAALAPDGIVAVNAVSPETTPAAFGCLATTLATAGLRPRAYVFDLPSFAREGYGRWAFLFASARPIGDDEIRVARFPADAAISGAAILAGAMLPVGAGKAMRAGPNVTDELLCYLASASPMAWRPPYEPLRLPVIAGSGPRLTVAEGFARWMRQPEGRRTLDTLLTCVPTVQRDAARAQILEWARQAEIMFREVDLRAFAERALRQAARLPEAWRRELAEFAARVRDGLPTLRELLEVTWRVFAVFLLALLLANILFPDNAYAKGYRSSSSSSSSSSESGPPPEEVVAPFGFRTSPAERHVRVADARGKHHPSASFMIGEGLARRRVTPLLALTPALRLLPSGEVGYHAQIPEHQLLVHPDRIDVIAAADGEHVISLVPSPSVLEETASALTAQEPIVERAIAQHRRWLDWTRWGAALPPGREAQREMAELESMRQSFAAARSAWQASTSRPDVGPRPGWHQLLPGLYFDPSRRDRRHLVAHVRDGSERRWSIDPPERLTSQERFLYAVLQWRVRTANESQWGPIIERWAQVYPDLPKPRQRAWQ